MSRNVNYPIPPPSGTPPTAKLRPWVAKTGPLISFLCDDGVLYQSQFGQISTVSPTQGRLEIHAPPHGVIAIAGPQARELCLALESQRATMIRTDKLGLTSVVRLSEQQYALQKIEAATPASNAEPDLDELD